MTDKEGKFVVLYAVLGRKVLSMFAIRRLCRTFLLVLTLATPILAQQAAPPSAFRWENDVEVAKRLAAQTNRLVLLHFWAPWCQPCMRLDQEVFSNPAFGAQIAGQYVAVKLNYDQSKKLADQFAIQSIPADVIITPQGQLVEKTSSPPGMKDYVGKMQQIALRAQAQSAPANAVVDCIAPTPRPPASDDRYADYYNRGQTPASAPTTPAYANQAAQTPQYAPQTPTMNCIPQMPWTAAATPPGAAGTAAQPPMTPPPAAQVAAAQPPVSQNPWSPPPAAPVAAGNAMLATATGSNTTQPAAPNAATLPHYTYNAPGAPAAAGPPPVNPAAPPSAGGPQLPPGSPPLGLDGFCPVTLIEQRSWKSGDPRYGAIHRNRTYIFCGPAEQQRFLQNPDAYSPMMSGDDPVLALDQSRSVSGSRKHGVFFGNRVYLFSSEQTLAEFQRNPNRYAPEITQARRPDAR